MSNLQEYISKRIRVLRIKEGMTQEMLEEKAELGTNYVYKIENLEPNIKIKTLEKIMKALDVDIPTFFDVTLKEEDSDLVKLIDNLKALPAYKQKKLIKAINTIMTETKWQNLFELNNYFRLKYNLSKRLISMQDRDKSF